MEVLIRDRRAWAEAVFAAWVVLALLAGALAGLPTTALADSGPHSHFRYGHYSWSPAGGNTITFAVQNAWRRDANPCVDPSTNAIVPCSGADGFPAPGDVIVEFTGGTVFDFGDGSAPAGSPQGPLYYLVTSIDAPANWLFGLALDPNSLPSVDTTITHTYPTSGDFLARTDSCCRISPPTHINNPDGGYRVETLVNVSAGNSSPVSSLPPIVNCPIEAVCSFVVPASDPNGDTLSFRLSTSSEASSFGPFTQPGPPHAPNAAVINSTSGVYTWDTTGATLNPSGPTFYSTQVTIEDRDSLGNVKSKVAVDFLIQLKMVIPPEPEFVSPPSPCGQTITATAGTLVTYDVTAQDAGPPGDVVTLNAVGVPPGASHAPPLPTTGNPVTTTFSWTPTAGDAGTHVITYTATDTFGNQKLCSVIIEVTPPRQANLSVEKTDSPDPVTSGSTLTYTVTVTNNGPGDATGVMVVDTLPAGVTFGSAVSSQGNCTESGGVVTCDVGSLVSGASATITITVTPFAVGTMVDMVSVTANEDDPDLSNNEEVEETTVAPLAVVIDIKPGSFPNTIKLSSSGLITVAILTTPSFDATTVDPTTVCFGDAEDPSQRDCTEAHGTGHIEDADGDGDFDLVLHFETSQTGIDLEDTRACLSGVTSGGVVIEGCDSVRPLP